MSSLQVKAKDGSMSTRFYNDDQPGTPENYKAYCISGGRGNGGYNYTGTFTNSLAKTPCKPSTCLDMSVSFARMAEMESEAETIESSFIKVTAYPNPFNSVLHIDFATENNSIKTTVELLSITGAFVDKIFDKATEGGMQQSLTFDAGMLPEGIYIYKITTDAGVMNGRVILTR